MTQSDPLSKEFEALNHTELYQLCRAAGLTVTPATGRDRLVELLLGVGEPNLAEAQHPIDRYRLALIGFVGANWERIQTQITCPMRELPTNPRPCFGCLDSHVVSCLVDNRANLDKIEKYKP